MCVRVFLQPPSLTHHSPPPAFAGKIKSLTEGLSIAAGLYELWCYMCSNPFRPDDEPAPPPGAGPDPLRPVPHYTAFAVWESGREIKPLIVKFVSGGGSDKGPGADWHPEIGAEYVGHTLEVG